MKPEATTGLMPAAPAPADLALNAPISGIVDLINYGREREGLIPLWAGEGDLATPGFINQAAAEVSLKGKLSIPGSEGYRNCARPSPTTWAG